MNALWLIELGRDGARNLVRHKLRSTLTLLGVVFGVGAVITMLAIGEGAQRTVLREIEGLGLKNIILDSTQPPAASRTSSGGTRRGPQALRYGLNEKDVMRIRAVLPTADLSVAHLVKQKVYLGSTRIDARTLGVTPDYFSLFHSRIVSGRGLTPVDERDGRSVAIVTRPVAEAWNGVGGIVGQTLRIGTDHASVVGVIDMPSRLAGSTVYLPYTTARRLFGSMTVKRESGSMEFTETKIGQVVIRLADEAQIPEAARVLDRTIRETHTSPDVVSTVPVDLLQSKQRTQRVLNLVLIAIAAISLLVGGIGIMNIMLAVVTERIPEIGVRRAVGAAGSDILLQFLAETVVLSSAGGLIGCAAGMAAVPLASQWTGWPGVITPTAVIVSLAVSWIVGVVFGFAPAMRAARLKPVECLRYE